MSNEEDKASEIDLKESYPELKEAAVPGLGRINGIGFGLYGTQNQSAHGTYVSTRMFSILYIPIFAIDAYVVADAEEGGWYFFGKVPLSSFVKKWNIFLLFLSISIGVGVFVDQHINSDAYKTNIAQSEARELNESKEYIKSARLCKSLLLTNAPATEKTTAILREASKVILDSNKTDEIIEIV